MSLSRSARFLLAGALCVAATTTYSRAAAAQATTKSSTAAATPGCGRTWAPGTDVNGAVTSGGVQRTYLLHIPQGYNPTTALPLVLNLSGTGMTGKDEETLTHMSTTADASHFLVVYPTGSGAPLTWNMANKNDLTFLSALVTVLEGQLCVDTTRVDVTGMSVGASMVYFLACNNVPWLAAIAPVDSTLPMAQFQCKMAHPTALIAFNGTLDPIIPYNGASWMPPIPQTIAGWARAVGCPGAGQAGLAQGDVVETYYAPCGTGADTQLYTVTDGGHQWPGGVTIPGLGFNTKVIDASALIAQFFIAHPLH